MSEAFEDKKLIEIAQGIFYSQKEAKDSENLEEIQTCFKKDKLIISERNLLINFIYSYKYRKPMSMTDMKRAILEKIGTRPENHYSNTFSRNEVEAIYTYFMKQESK